MAINITLLLGFFKELILLAMEINGIQVTKRELEVLKMLYLAKTLQKGDCVCQFFSGTCLMKARNSI